MVDATISQQVSIEAEHGATPGEALGRQRKADEVSFSRAGRLDAPSCPAFPG